MASDNRASMDPLTSFATIDRLIDDEYVTLAKAVCGLIAGSCRRYRRSDACTP